ncbi:anaphase-promoting complex subunit 15 [Aphis craccivora]|uniref:Anaphase-promoting complex subunit 15 n=1 Tax=Aphis craccivora TaxID=307492 RepID=A0A6G0YAP1_APHCR|nr:anaphase-promoting complex subunit 15 [Aphis craccivora]
MNSGIPIFPTMIPNIVNPLWFSVDEPKNEDTELLRIESIHQNWLLTLTNKINDKDFPVPIGKTATEVMINNLLALFVQRYPVTQHIKGINSE